MKNIKQIVSDAFLEITTKGEIDIKEGNKPIDMNDKVSDIPNKMYEHVNNGGKGCCFVFASYMLKCLYDNDVEASMITTPEGNGIRASVLYEDAGEKYVANPVNDIEYFTEHEIPSAWRNMHYVGTTLITRNNKTFDSSRIPLQDFANMYGDVKEIGSFTDETDLKTKMNDAKVIKRLI